MTNDQRQSLLTHVANSLTVPSFWVDGNDQHFRFGDRSILIDDQTGEVFTVTYGENDYRVVARTPATPKIIKTLDKYLLDESEQLANNVLNLAVEARTQDKYWRNLNENCVVQIMGKDFYQ